MILISLELPSVSDFYETYPGDANLYPPGKYINLYFWGTFSAERSKNRNKFKLTQ